MSYSFRPAKREGVQLLIGIAGASSSGKTLSALRVAAGLAGGQPFAYIDTESGRALHYADDFDFLHCELAPPFSPARYREAIAAAAEINPPVIVIDSMTHEHSGPGGVLEMHDAELDRRAGNDFKKRESYNMSAWIKPKQERKLLIDDLLRLRCHVILCFRAEEKVDIVPDPKRPGKTKIVPKRTVAGHVGWIPVAGKEYAFELTLSLVVTPEKPGVPHAIKIMDRHKPLVSSDRPLDEQVGVRLGEWAAGGTLTEGGSAAPRGDIGTPATDEPSTAGNDVAPPSASVLADRIRDLGPQLGENVDVEPALARHVGDVEWLQRQVATMERAVAERAALVEGDAVEPAGVPAAGEHGDDSSAPSANAEQPSLYDQIASKATERGAA